jgi:hypothetical protein
MATMTKGILNLELRDQNQAWPELLSGPKSPCCSAHVFYYYKYGGYGPIVIASDTLKECEYAIYILEALYLFPNIILSRKETG